MKRAVVLVLFGFTATAAADQILLKNGGRIEGVVVEQTDRLIFIDVGPGRLALPTSSVERVLQGTAALAQYRQRAGHLAEHDVPGWLALAQWAQGRDLLTQARAAFEHVVALDAQNAVAQRALGNVPMGDRWVSPEESYRARGYVFYDGSWVTPQEARERAEAAALERARTEADARLREADARARAAESEARSTASGAPIYGLPVYPSGAGIVTSACCPATSPPLTPRPAPKVVVDPPPRFPHSDPGPPPHVVHRDRKPPERLP